MNAARRSKGSKTPSEPFVADFSEGLETGLYLALLELIDEGLIITGDELILEVNTAACRLLERDYRDLAGHPLATLFPSEQAFLGARERLFIQGETRGNLEVALPDGGQRTLRFIAAARLRPGVHALILSPEATNEGEAEAARPDSLWPRLAAALEQPVIVIDESGVVAAANAMALRTLDVERSKLVGRPLEPHVSVEWPPHGAAPVAIVRPAGQTTEVRARVLPGPRPGWRVLILPPAPPAFGGPATSGVPASTVPGANSFFERVFAESPLPTFLCEGPQMRIFAANAAAARTYGYTREALCAMSVPELRAGEQADRIPGERGGVWRHRRSDGSLFDVEILAYPIDSPGHPDAMVLMHDVPDMSLLSTRARLPASVIEAAAQAIDHNQLQIHFQPLVDTRTATIRSGEALLRWKHPTLGLIPFRRFMRVARDGGLLAGMGDWVLKNACAHAARWPESGGRRPGVTVNIAAEQVLQGDLPERVRQALRKSALAGERLELDLEEQLLGEDNPRVLEALTAIHAAGVRLAIDDFGRGLTSIPRLKRYPITTLKLDPALVRDVGRNEENEAIVEAIVSMANVLGLEVLARGVATREQQAFLAALGCHLQQGPLFGRPMAAQDFRELIAGNTP